MEDELDYGSDHSVQGDDNRASDSEDEVEQPKDSLDVIIDRDEMLATEKAFGLDASNDKHLRVSIAETRALRKELAVDGEAVLDSVLVHGVDSMDEFEIHKIFADFRAGQVWKNGNLAIVEFPHNHVPAAMMLNMSKMMRRVRGRKKAEDGEVMSDGDDDVEEGQIMQEKGDDVELIEGLQANETGIVTSGEGKKSEFVTVDVTAREIPDGKWRVLTKHVRAGTFVIVRYPTVAEFRDITRAQSGDGKLPTKRGNSNFWSHESSNRGGLNVFDKEGKELEWDYEHDTRFYDEEKETEKKEKVQLPKGIKVRGRGAVKCGFLFGEGSGSLASDDSSPSKRRKTAEEEKEYEKDDVVSRMGKAAHAIRPGRVEKPMRERLRFPERRDDY